MPWVSRILLHASIGSFLLGVPEKAEAVKEEVQNVRFRQERWKILILYDLVGEGAYGVTLHVSKDVGNTFSINPQSVSGDVGPVVYGQDKQVVWAVHPGKNKQIVWDVLKDVRELIGNGFVFEVRAVRQKKNSMWPWVAGAGIGSAGAAAGVLILGKGKNGTILIDVPDPEE